MSDNYIQVEGHPDLVRDKNSHAIINRNRSAYDQAKKRAKEAQEAPLTEEQKQKWIKKKCHISRGDCEHVLALDEFKAVTHAVDKKHVFAEAVQLKKSAEKGVSDGAGVW